MAPKRGSQRKQCGASECERQFRNERSRMFMRRYKAKHGVSYVRKYRKPEQDEERFALLGELNRQDPERAAARKQESWHRRRARKRMAPFDRFRHADVYERDAWVCQLCSRVVDPDLRHPDPLSASLDHKLPLARGGHHVWDNVQLAHLTCNVTKNARIDWSPEAA
jgi:5-methylcytosine-specific restriction endonuclease McrA